MRTHVQEARYPQNDIFISHCLFHIVIILFPPFLSNTQVPVSRSAEVTMSRTPERARVPAKVLP